MPYNTRTHTPIQKLDYSNYAHLSTLLAELFPPCVIAAELETPGDLTLLLPEELSQIQSFAAKRKREFAAGRQCARRALAEFGIVNTPLIMSSNRYPCWPDSMIGSITHTRGFCGAVVSERCSLRALGVDAEVVAQVTPATWQLICTPQEISWLAELPLLERAQFAAAIFSAKEAFYKCQYAITATWLGFQDVGVTIERDADVQTVQNKCCNLQSGRFAVHVLKPNYPHYLLGDEVAFTNGRFRFCADLVVTGMAFPAS